MNDLLLTLAMAALGQLGGYGAAPGIGPGPGMGVPQGIPPGLVGGIGPGIRIGISGPGLQGLPGGYGGYGGYGVPGQGYPRPGYPGAGGMGPGYPGGGYPIGAYPGIYSGGLAPRGGIGRPGVPLGLPAPQGLQPRQPVMAAPVAPPSSEAEAFGLAPYR